MSPGNRRVLVVEDEDDLRHLIARLLSRRYTVIEAENGEKGAIAIIQERPDLIICDMDMPELDGMHVIRIARESMESSFVPIILTSGNRPPEGLEDLRVIFLPKPFGLTHLMELVENALATVPAPAEN